MYIVLCMKTTILLDDQLLAEAKQRAAQTGRTLKAVIEDAPRETLVRTEATWPQARVPLKTCKGRGVQPGVDLDATSSLLNLMERDGVSEWITTDRDFSRFPDLRWRHPLA